MKNQKKYCLIPADIEIFNIEDFNNCYKDGLGWGNRRTNNYHKLLYNVGDTVFIYYKNLTDGSNRILFRGEVLDNDYNYLSYRDKKEMNGIKIGNIKALSLKEKTKFDYHKLIEMGVKNFRSPHILCFEGDLTNNLKDLKTSLVCELEQSSKDTIATTEKYFNQNKLCESCNLLNKPNWKYRTIKKENGFIYYELHHILMKNKKGDMSFLSLTEYKQLIDAEFNKAVLCPVCHKEIHYGKKEERKKILDIILDEHKYKEQLKKEYKFDEKQIKDIISYIYSLYEIDCII